MITLFLLAGLEDAIRQKYLNIKYLKADFIEIVKNPRMDEEQQFKGTLEYFAPNRVVFHITYPEEQKMIVEGDRMTFIRGADTVVQQLEEEFVFNPYKFLTEESDKFQKTITKKGDKIYIDVKGDSEMFKGARFVLDATDYRVLEIRATDSFDVEYIFRFTNVVMK